MPPRESTEAVETASLHWVGYLRSRRRVAVVAGTWRSSASVRRTLLCAFDMLSNLDMVSYRGEGCGRGLAPVLVRGTGALMPMPGAILDRVAGSSPAGSIVSQCPPGSPGWMEMERCSGDERGASRPAMNVYCEFLVYGWMWSEAWSRV